ISSIALGEGQTTYVAGGTISTAFLTTPGAWITQYPEQFNSGFAAKLDFSKPGQPRLYCIANAASLAAGRNGRGIDGSVAPGEIVSFFGAGFDAGSELNITFDGKPAPILCADTGEINAVVPFQTGSSGNTLTVVLVHQGSQTIGGFELPIAPASPGLFTSGGGRLFPDEGIGGAQLAALNEDESVNSASNPATPGSIVSLFMTGVGAYNIAMKDGDTGPLVPPYPMPVLGVSAAFISQYTGFVVPNEHADVVFAGQAPGLVAGVVQVNIRIPEDAQQGSAG